MSRFPHYRDSPEARAFRLPTRSLGAGLRRRVRELEPRLPLAAVFGLRTAAFLHGLDVLPRSVTPDCWPVEVVVPPGTTVPRRLGLRVYRWNLGPDVQQRDGVLVTTPVRTALDCARVLPRLDAVAAVDQFLRHGVEPAQLRRHAARLGRAARSPVVDSILDAADARSDSPLESWTRCLVTDAGLPRPVTQLPVTMRDGSVAHLDLGYRRFAVGIECDGRRYHGTETAREHDTRRRRWLETCGWSIQVVHASDVFVRPDEMLDELRQRLCERGWRPSAEESTAMAKRVRYIAMAMRHDREDWNAAWGLPGPVTTPRRRGGSKAWRNGR